MVHGALFLQVTLEHTVLVIKALLADHTIYQATFAKTPSIISQTQES